MKTIKTFTLISLLSGAVATHAMGQLPEELKAHIAKYVSYDSINTYQGIDNYLALASVNKEHNNILSRPETIENTFGYLSQHDKIVYLGLAITTNDTKKGKSVTEPWH